MLKIDMTNKQFGRLLVIEQSDYVKHGRPRWLCRCDCGNEVVVDGTPLRRGDVVSCGCARKERAIAMAKGHITHGGSKTRLYRIWHRMKCRCYKINAPDYARYGGRGITVCDEWLKDFESFRSWALSNGYNENLTIDRINVNGNYCPSNCRWADAITQHNNTRSNHFLTFRGETLTISQWSARYGINKNTLWSRIGKYGWSVERALTEEVKK